MNEVSQEKHALYYNMKTEPGHSGSPIILVPEGVIGIHTHGKLDNDCSGGLIINK